MTGRRAGLCRVEGVSPTAVNRASRDRAGLREDAQGGWRRRRRGWAGRIGGQGWGVASNPLPVDWNDITSLREELEAVRMQADMLSKRIGELENASRRV
jgi:hypothetical protein